MSPKRTIIFLLGKADGHLEEALNLAPTDLPQAWVQLNKAMDDLAFCAGAADARAIWKSQWEAALAIKAMSTTVLALIQSMIQGTPDPNWTGAVAKIRTDIQTLLHRGKFR